MGDSKKSKVLEKQPSGIEIRKFYDQLNWTKKRVLLHCYPAADLLKIAFPTHKSIKFFTKDTKDYLTSLPTEHKKLLIEVLSEDLPESKKEVEVHLL